MGGDGRLLAAAVVGAIAILAWTMVHMVPFFFVLKIAGLLRVDAAEEMSGLDVSHHGGSAYEGGAHKDTDGLVHERLAALEQEIMLLKKK